MRPQGIGGAGALARTPFLDFGALGGKNGKGPALAQRFSFGGSSPLKPNKVPFATVDRHHGGGGGQEWRS